jgi:hypothetical protein
MIQKIPGRIHLINKMHQFGQELSCPLLGVNMRTIIIFCLILLSSFLYSNYDVVDRIELSSMYGNEGFQINENMFLMISAKTLNLVYIENDQFTLIDKHYSNNFFSQNYFVHDDIYYISTYVNGTEMYSVDGNSINFLGQVGDVTNEQVTLYSGAAAIYDSLLFTETLYTYNEYSESHLQIYDTFNDNTLYASYTMNSEDRIQNVFKINDFYYFIRYNGQILYTDIDGLSDFSVNEVEYNNLQDFWIYSSYLIEDKLYLYFTDFQTGFLKEFSFINESELMVSNTLELPFIPVIDILKVDNTLILWGQLSGFDAEIKVYQITDSGWILETDRVFENELVGSIFPFEENFLALSGERTLILDSDLNTHYVLNESYFYTPCDIFDSRYLIMQKNKGYNEDGIFIYDLFLQEFTDLEFNNDWFYNISKRSYNNNAAIFTNGNLAKLVLADDTGSLNVIELEFDFWLYSLTYADNVLAVSYQNEESNFCVSCYYFNNGDLELIGTQEFSSLHGKLQLINNEYLLISFSENYVTTNEYYNINNDSFEFITSFETGSSVSYFFEDKLIFQTMFNDIYNFADLENPIIEAMISEPCTTNGRASYNGHGYLLFDKQYTVSVVDRQYDVINCWGDISFTYFFEDNQIIICEYDHLTIAELPYVSSNNENIQCSIENIQLQNHPNPFNPTTTISFSLNNLQHENVQIEIFNIKGQQVDQLIINNYQSGVNEIVWNASEFSSGVYFYKLVLNKKTIDRRKMLLLK